jgi:DNA helicase-2/ATP-dependent DNA helicase PcrA
MDFSKELNTKQFDAVTSTFQYTRIIAGAGSGKTRVLTYRIAYLLTHLAVKPEAILAITFTNKVAKEMFSRACQLVPQVSTRLKIMTYHSFAARFLRREIHHLQYPNSFTIIDDEDQSRLIKTIAQEKGFRKSDDIVKQSLNYITSHKTKGILPDAIRIDHERFAGEKLCLEFYQTYEDKLKRMAILDFDDLLLKSIIILEQFPQVRDRWQHYFSHVLIDEFQDTNDVQYHLLKLLLTKATCLYVVGDPDQTIYSWRGANQKIILDLHTQYPIETIILNQNYRSTQAILQTANTLIDHNKMRVKKDLFSLNEKGQPVVGMRLANHEEEARWVIQHILALGRQGNTRLQDVLILYRANYLTLPFEKELNRLSIPYRIFGGMRFYQRKEIKDAIAYFKLLINELDDTSTERIINVPRRGIGDKTIELIKLEANQQQRSLLQYFASLDLTKTQLSEKTVTNLINLAQDIALFRQHLVQKDEIFSEILKQYLQKVGYLESLKAEDEEGRLENIQTLFEDIESYINDNPQSDFKDYLENIALTSSQDDIIADDFISLMTIHTAKGLEFDHVYVIGMNEGIFPSVRTLAEDAYVGLEEERRLCYVAMTRARKTLHLTCSMDYSHVIGGSLTPSRFLHEAEIQFQYQDGARQPSTMGVTQRQVENQVYQALPNQHWQVGDKVIHETFGEGVIIQVVDTSIIEVSFKNTAPKKLIANHPKLKKVS